MFFFFLIKKRFVWRRLEKHFRVNAYAPGKLLFTVPFLYPLRWTPVKGKRWWGSWVNQLDPVWPQTDGKNNLCLAKMSKVSAFETHSSALFFFFLLNVFFRVTFYQTTLREIVSVQPPTRGWHHIVWPTLTRFFLPSSIRWKHPRRHAAADMMNWTWKT